MNVPAELSEFLPPYIAEVEELLASARTGLLALEREARHGPPGTRAVQEVFRAIHTIKGLSAMVDVESIVSISHLMEAALRNLGRSSGRPAAGWVETLLQGLAAIEQRVKALGEGQDVPAPSASLLERLEALLLPQAPTSPGKLTPATLLLDPVVLAKLSAADVEQLHQGVSAGRRALRVDFAPSPATASAGFTITSVRERMGKVAEIVKVLPLSVAVSELTPGGLVFALLVLTRETDEAVAAVAGVDVGRVQPITVAEPTAPSPSAEELPEEPGAIVVPPEADVEMEGAARHGFVRVRSVRLDDAIERIGALVVNRSRLSRAVAALTASGVNTRELTQILAENGRLLRDSRASVLRLRMLPVREILERLPLMVRGLRRSTGKDVSLQMDVGHAELDKAVGDRLFPALVHLVRNAVDHALEAPEERVRAGKPPVGHLRISCHETSNSRLELVIADDGRGIQAEQVASRAGVPVPTSPEGLLELLCRPGLSTRDEVTTTSGRGMGMDIVKRIVVEQLGGELVLETRPGQGTTFRVSVPLTISILDAFVFDVDDERYAAPVVSVSELIEVDLTKVFQTPTPVGRGHLAVHGMIERRGAALPLVRLGGLLNSGGTRLGGKAIIVNHRKQPVAFAVDRMVSQQEIVVRPLEDPLLRVPGVAGATDLGDGKPTLVLDLIALTVLPSQSLS